jgi:uncharacterized membrane protein
LTKKRVIADLLFALLFILATTSHPAISQEVTPEALFLTVYSDGFVFIDYTLLVDPKSPTQNITVFGQVIEDLLVVDEDGLPLDYSLIDSLLSVYSLGADEIEITYLTQDLTSKDGRFWTLTIDAPLTTVIITPEETTIISLNQVPETVETSDNRVELQMNAGLIEVTYVIGVVGTKEHAQIVLDDAETTINEIISLGINATEAETKLTEAMDAFDLGNYVEAETTGNEAKNLALQINQTATQAQLQIDEAEDAIANAQNEGRTIGLNEAQALFNQANSAYDNGNYIQSLNLAIQARTKAEEAKTSEDVGPLLFLGVFGAIFIPIVVFGFFIIRLKRESKDQEISKKKRLIDIERIFREHMDLMPEEKRAVQFLVDNNGEAFEAELYDYVRLPRTTTWRLVKRLERMGIIRTSKFRRQNLIRVKSKYDIKE